MLDRKSASGETFNLGDGKTVSVNKIAEIVTEILRDEYQIKAEAVHVPPKEGEPYVEDVRFSVDKIETKTGFKTQWSIREGIKQTTKYYLKAKSCR